jgi:chaperone modulatory protein CbpM
MSEALFSISFTELCKVDGIEKQHIIDIVEYGIIEPIGDSIELNMYEQWLFDTNAIYWAKKALRLHQDFDVEWVGIAMVIRLMKEKEFLQKENERYQRQLSRFTSN